MNLPTRISLSLSALLGVASATGAQTIETLVLEGDPVAGVGLVTRVDNLAINDGGEWIVEVDTDNPDGDADGALIKNGALYVQEGQSLTAPAGALVDSFDSVYLNAAGNGSFNFFLDGTAGTSDDSGLYWNTSLLIQESYVSTAPQFSANTPYIGFFEVRINNSDQLLVIASVDDPAIASSVDRALVRLDTDGAGNLLSETVVKMEGDLAGSGSFPILDFGTGPQYFAFNEPGQVMYYATLSSGTADDVAIYIDDTLIAEEGAPAPVAGRLWKTLSSCELGLNNLGDHVFQGIMDGDTATDSLICRNGVKFRQEGDSIPAIGAFQFTSFGTGPVEIADTGDVLWYGDWNDPDLDVDTGLFLNDTLLVQEGVTTIGGVVVDSLRGITDGYHLSDNGRYVIFEALLADGNEGAFRIPISIVGTAYCAGDGTYAPCPCGNVNDGSMSGCDWQTPSGTAGGSLTAIGSNLWFNNDTFLVATNVNADFGIFFGAPTQVAGTLGDGLRCAGGGLIRLIPPTNPGGSVATHAVPLQILDPAAAGGVTRQYQYWFRSPNSPCGSGSSTTNGYSIQWL